MDNKIWKQDYVSTIKQHNAITEARYEMTALQKNIFYLLLAQLKDGEYDKNRYELSIGALNEIRNVRVNKEEILQSARGLISSGLNLYDPIQKTSITIGILASANYKGEKNKEILSIEFDTQLYPFLYNVKNRFTTFSLADALKLKSKYAKRIYEMLSQYKDTGVFKITVKELKERLGLIDLKSGKEQYSEFGLFAKYVLEVALKEINDQTDIRFTYIAKKTGKKITDLEFRIIYKPNNIKKHITPPLDLSISSEISQKESNQLQKVSSKKEKEFEKLPLEQSEVYRKLINSPQKNGLGWLKSEKPLAYALVNQISVDSLWDHINRIKTDISNSELTYSISEYFKEILNSRNQKVQSNIKEKVKNIDEPSSLEIQNSVAGRYYKKMNIEFGINILTIGEIANQVSFDILKEAIDQISQEDLQQKSLSDKSNYVLNRLINELRLDLSQK
jgi:plasmid replication initiation protein